MKGVSNLFAIWRPNGMREVLVRRYRCRHNRFLASVCIHNYNALIGGKEELLTIR
jgi:hypothetical protein